MSPKNPAAVALGRRGGEARARKLTSAERSQSARKAVEARWAKTKELVEDISERTEALERRATKKEKQ